MKANIARGFVGYVFLLVLAGACIATGAITFDENLPTGIFGVVLGVVILGVGAIMAFRKN